jgi:hypothetical protein
MRQSVDVRRELIFEDANLTGAHLIAGWTFRGANLRGLANLAGCRVVKLMRPFSCLDVPKGERKVVLIFEKQTSATQTGLAWGQLQLEKACGDSMDEGPRSCVSCERMFRRRAYDMRKIAFWETHYGRSAGYDGQLRKSPAARSRSQMDKVIKYFMTPPCGHWKDALHRAGGAGCPTLARSHSGYAFVVLVYSRRETIPASDLVQKLAAAG